MSKGAHTLPCKVGFWFQFLFVQLKPVGRGWMGVVADRCFGRKVVGGGALSFSFNEGRL